MIRHARPATWSVNAEPDDMTGLWTLGGTKFDTLKAAKAAVSARMDEYRNRCR